MSLDPKPNFNAHFQKIFTKWRKTSFDRFSVQTAHWKIIKKIKCADKTVPNTRFKNDQHRVESFREIFENQLENLICVIKKPEIHKFLLTKFDRQL